MANQDDIIIIRTVESITTSILDYFFNIAFVTEIEEDDLLDSITFDPSGIEQYASMLTVAEKFKPTSKIYKIANAIFAQKNNTGANQSNLKRLVIYKKTDSEDFQTCMTRLGLKNSYFVLINPKQDSEIESAYEYLNTRRKLMFVQTKSQNVASNGTDDIATKLKGKKAGRVAMYYHLIDTECLAGAIASILASYPIGRKTASYKTPTGITVDNLSDTVEGYLKGKNVNYYVSYIGGADDYSKRELTSDNGVVLSGDEIQKVISVDRTILSLQSNTMDALVQDIPYDDNGGTIVYNKINDTLSQLKREGIFAEDSVDTETGEILKSYTINVLTTAETKKYYKEYYAQKMFIVEIEVIFAGSAKKVMLTLAY